MPGPRIPAQAVQLHHLHPKVTARALGGIAVAVSASLPGNPNQGDVCVTIARGGAFVLNVYGPGGWQSTPINAAALTGENFNISASGQYHYKSPPAYNTWSFEQGLGGWAASPAGNASITVSPAQARTGSFSALLTYQSGSSWAMASPQQAAPAGCQAFAAAWVYAPQALGAVGLQLAWYNSSGTLLSTSSAPTAALAASTWTQFTWNATAPSGAATVSVVIQDDETSVTGYQLYADDVYISGPLAVAIAPAAGSDNLGVGHPIGLYTSGGDGTGLTMSTGVASEAAPGNTGTTSLGSGSTAQLATGLWGPKMSGGTAFADFVSAIMASSQEGTSGTATGSLYYTSGSGAATQVLRWGADGVEITGLSVGALTANGLLTLNAGAGTGASSLAGGIIISQADYGWTSQTNPTSFSRIAKVWDIPQGDPVQGTAYRLSAFGSGVWQGNPLSFQITAFGQSIAPLTVGGTFMSAGASYDWDLVATLIITQTGSAGILSGSIRLNMAQSANNQLPNTGSNAAGGFVGTQAAEPVAGIGTADASMTVQAEYQSSASGQSILGIGSVFERIGGNA